MSKLRCAILLILLLIYLSSIHAINDMPVIAAFQGEHHNSAFGFSLVSLDFNHDGIDDLVVCSNNYGYIYPGTTYRSRGKIYIYEGTTGFNTNTSPALTYEGTYDSTRVGRQVHAVYKVGDINGDGFDDLCMHVTDNISWNERYGKLLFFYGGTTNLDDPDYVLNFYGNVYTFFRLLPLGDVNGDGYDDMGFYYLHTPSYQNRLSIIWGGSFQEHVVSNGEASYSYSCSIHGIGDINNDGFADFTTAFATPTTDPTHNLIRLYYGNAEGSTDDPITLIYCQYGVSRGSKPLGDMNGDGYDDFMGYITDEGMHAWLGGTDINYSVPDFDMDPSWYGGEFQRCLEHGDFNNDGFEDVVGASFGSGFAVWLGKENVNGTADLIIHNPGYENFGYSLVTGDFNADGYCDIAIAASHEYDPWPHGNYTGYVWVYAGNAQLTDTTVANDDSSIPSISSSLVMNLSPNPITKSAQYLNVDLKGGALNKGDQITLEIFNIKGQVFYHAEDNNMATGELVRSIDLSHYTSGLYLCRAKAGDHTTIKKFTIIK